MIIITPHTATSSGSQSHGERGGVTQRREGAQGRPQLNILDSYKRSQSLVKLGRLPVESSGGERPVAPRHSVLAAPSDCPCAMRWLQDNHRRRLTLRWSSLHAHVFARRRYE